MLNGIAVALFLKRDIAKRLLRVAFAELVNQNSSNKSSMAAWMFRISRAVCMLAQKEKQLHAGTIITVLNTTEEPKGFRTARGSLN